MNCILFYGNDQSPGVSRYAGPHRLATSLRDNGFETICIDIGMLQNSKDLPVYQKIIDKFVSKDTFWVGFSTTFFDTLCGISIKRISELSMLTDKTENTSAGFLKEVIEMCKSKNNKIKFVVGGGNYINLHAYDFIHFRGNADFELVEFTKWCKDSKYVPRLDYKDRIISCKEYSGFVSSKIKWHEYDLITHTDVLPIEVSRGCIFKCKFCAFPLNGKTKGEWIKYAEVLKEELEENYQRWGTTEYIFSDDTYNDSLYKITELYDKVFSRLSFKIKWTSYLRLDLMYRFKESAEILKKSGLKNVMFGIETNNSASAKVIGKGLDFDKQISYLKEIKLDSFKEILTSSGFIYGLPFDTEESINSLHEWLLSDDNPLDSWAVTTLGINPSDKTFNKNSFSDIDINYQSYGYVIDSQDQKNRIMNWSLPKNNISYNNCKNLSNMTMNIGVKKDSFKAGSFSYPRYRSLEIGEQDLMSLSHEQIMAKYNVKQLVKYKNFSYLNTLLSL